LKKILIIRATNLDDAGNGHPVPPAFLKGFIGRVHHIVPEEANGRAVYLAEAVFNSGTDLMLWVAKRLKINLDQANSKIFPARADRVSQSDQRQSPFGRNTGTDTSVALMLPWLRLAHQQGLPCAIRVGGVLAVTGEVERKRASPEDEGGPALSRIKKMYFKSFSYPNIPERQDISRQGSRRTILTQSGNKKKGSYLSFYVLLAYFFSILKRSGNMASKNSEEGAHLLAAIERTKAG
jgi:hypothetical protein